jgi:hypothetical protein
MENLNAVVVEALAMIEGYDFFDREIAATAGSEILAQNPWMDARDVRDWMIYKLTGEAP